MQTEGPEFKPLKLIQKVMCRYTCGPNSRTILAHGYMYTQVRTHWRVETGLLAFSLSPESVRCCFKGVRWRQSRIPSDFLLLLSVHRGSAYLCTRSAPHPSISKRSYEISYPLCSMRTQLSQHEAYPFKAWHLTCTRWRWKPSAATRFRTKT